MAITEKEFQSQVLEEAATYGWIAYHTYDSRRSQPGFPDMVLSRPDSPVIMAELKTENGKVTSAQREWLRNLRESSICMMQEYDMPYPPLIVDVWRPADTDWILSVLDDPKRAGTAWRDTRQVVLKGELYD